MLYLAVGSAHAQSPDFCDRGLEASAELGTTGYRNFPPSAPDRCEGWYVREVSKTSGLRLGGLLAAPRAVEAGAAKIRLAWRKPWAAATVRVRGEGFGRDFYRMDTRVEERDVFEWSTERWTENRSVQSLGVVAWTDDTIGRVYLPVTVGDTTPEGNRYLIEIEPAKELDEVYLSVASTDSQGRPVTFLVEEEPAGNSVYAQKACSRLQLDLEAPRGIYYLEIAAEIEGGGAAVEEVLFYHDGS